MDSRKAAAVVGEWMDRVIADRPVQDVACLFGAALVALWMRARTALGEVSLGAITTRVLRGARIRYPALHVLEVAANPEAFGALGASNVEGVDRQELMDAARFVLTEILALLGILTADILSPALHEALGSVTLTSATSHGVADRRDTP